MSLIDVRCGLPGEWPHNVTTEIRQELKRLNQKVVVLDDDPTGTQTVHDIPVLMDWDVDHLRAEFRNALPAFYILTNSRSRTAAEACELNRQIAINLNVAASQAKSDFVVISRSDSTLRGHFPREVDCLMHALNRRSNVVILLPFFAEGGRITVGDVHYVTQGQKLVPAGETEFARDPAFGYRASNLREWVEEKTQGRISAESVASISLDDIRVGGPDKIFRRLLSLEPGIVCIINCISTRDLEVFTLGLLRAELSGKAFLYRTAASFVPVRSGIDAQPLLSVQEVCHRDVGGGLVVCGSFVSQTTSQLEVLLRETTVEGVELEVTALLNPHKRHGEVLRLARKSSQSIKRGKTVAIFTTRELIATGNAEEALSLGQYISAALVDVVRSIDVRPRYVITKGGITSSDIATQALNVKRAMILGQVLPGVSVWELGHESRYPGLAYVVFPGNVGGPESLAKIVGMWDEPVSAGQQSE
jgi:uncharacterized protein YgbK (DUF1537 family)